ncbi:acyl-CoA reductase [Reichenbachiella sp. MALMAid0571]|uniref:acyl-CoA reductase n=1 Tax=Reichenbachiella sp. MALMAid0571 TaxID=3143939 RepID=UPI0032E05794
MIDKDRIVPFVQLGDYIDALLNGDDKEFFQAVQNQNNWFTEESVRFSLLGIRKFLDREILEKWTGNYTLPKDSNKRIGVIMAGNIPLVGFHDLLSVLISGHHIMVKPGSQDSLLMTKIINTLIEIEPEYKARIEIVERLNDADAFIGTGSDNSARYFKYYFGKKPHIIRKNRTSVAVLTGNESEEDIHNLGKDIFTYYGLGCRNVSKAYVPQGYSFQFFLDSLQQFESVGDHHKYRNNYDYNRSIYLVNREPHLDNGFLLVKESKELVSPISVLFYEQYESKEELKSVLKENEGKIQCIIGEEYIPFGKAQEPEVWDYADGVDTLEFLSQL